jgi:hypothetical protein
VGKETSRDLLSMLRLVEADVISAAKQDIVSFWMYISFKQILLSAL